jgi:uncharacterized circularly permuted ATP-grasp superfamily protein
MLSGYSAGTYYCEVTSSEAAAPVRERLNGLSIEELRQRAAQAEAELHDLGITFTVYSDKDAIDRVLPFDAIPRVISSEEWRVIQAGICQRVAAMNQFLHDIYHEQSVLKDGVVPAELVLGNAHYRPAMQGVDLPHRSYIHVCGTDLVRDGSGAFRVLEDNARTPSGVSYVVENRHTMQRAFPEFLDGISLCPVDDYGQKLLAALHEVAPPGITDPQVVLLSPGTFNSAYFEHVFLAREMGVPLVEGGDLVVNEDDQVSMWTTGGPRRVDVIYRRIDDDFLDPDAFRPDSLLGVPGLMRAYRAGKVSLANAVGTGVADDKAIYA